MASLPDPFALLVTIRFTANVPDLTLSIASPSKTTCLFLKYEIRNSLPPSRTERECNFRLIYRGKILPDTAYLGSALKLPPPPPRQKPIDVKGKGKEKAVDPEPTRVYINCAIGDILSPAQLQKEANAALASLTTTSPTYLEDELPQRTKRTGNDGSGSSTETGDSANASTTPAPRGFDRLLTTGFTAAEVAQLRLQFLAIQSHIHTPETMPSPTTLRSMEDAWIDNASTDGVGGGGGGFEDMDGLPGALDDLLWGNVMGFLWPLGALLAVREEGIWSHRRSVAVVGGAIISVMFGLMRVLS